jgi:folylpolyglutamate synthase/dihydropteroate synthase
MVKRKASNRKTLQALLSLQNMRRGNNPTTQTGTMRNGNIGSRTCTGVKARHTRLQTTPTINLDGAHPKDVVEAAAEAVEAPTEVKGANYLDGIKQPSPSILLKILTI